AGWNTWRKRWGVGRARGWGYGQELTDALVFGDDVAKAAGCRLVDAGRLDGLACLGDADVGGTALAEHRERSIELGAPRCVPGRFECVSDARVEDDDGELGWERHVSPRLGPAVEQQRVSPAAEQRDCGIHEPARHSDGAH